jgi:hypothetical protein
MLRRVRAQPDFVPRGQSIDPRPDITLEDTNRSCGDSVAAASSSSGSATAIVRWLKTQWPPRAATRARGMSRNLNMEIFMKYFLFIIAFATAIGLTQVIGSSASADCCGGGACCRSHQACCNFAH